MKRFTKDEIAEKAKHQEAVANAHAALVEAIEALNDAKMVAWDKVEEAKATLTEAITEAGEWRQTLCDNAQAYYDERSEKWQEGDAGQSYSAWLDALGTEIEDPGEDVSEPDDLDVPEDVSETIGEIPESPEEA